jgi:hypothetical protein
LAALPPEVVAAFTRMDEISSNTKYPSDGVGFLNTLSMSECRAYHRPGQAGIILKDVTDHLVEIKAVGSTGKVKGAGRAILKWALEKNPGPVVLQSVTTRTNELYATLGFQYVTKQQFWPAMVDAGHPVPEPSVKRQIVEGWDTAGDGPLYVNLRIHK